MSLCIVERLPMQTFIHLTFILLYFIIYLIIVYACIYMYAAERQVDVFNVYFRKRLKTHLFSYSFLQISCSA